MDAAKAAFFEKSRVEYESSPNFAKNIEEARKRGYRRITLSEQIETGSADAFTWMGGVWVPIANN